MTKHLERQGLMLREGSIVDASIIFAPSSTKNKQQGRAGSGDAPDPQGQPVVLRNEGASGVDAGFGMIHSLEVTPANVYDLKVNHALFHGDETHVYGDSGYLGIHKRVEHRHRDIDWFIARRRGKTRQLEPGSNWARAERIKASVRANVEHPFRTNKGKRQFG